MIIGMEGTAPAKGPEKGISDSSLLKVVIAIENEITKNCEN